MKKFFTLLSILFVVVLISGCKSAVKKYDIALITDVGTIDDGSFNQGTWEGVVKYADEHNISHKYYQPAKKTDTDYENAIDLAVKGGAKIVVTPGYFFSTAVYESQTKYPDVTFILIDGVPANPDNPDTPVIKNNVYPILFTEDQSGFLAGYAAAKEGFTKIGFMGGMALPAVIRYGYGFLQGLEVAGQEMGLNAGDITVNYTYLNRFDPDGSVTTQASSWYNSGTQVIFAAAGGAGNSVMTAASDLTDKYVIGVDVDQSGQNVNLGKNVVITSAMKELKNSVYQCLTAIYNKDNTEFKTGQVNTMDIRNDGVGLPTDFSNFPGHKFTLDDYNTLVTAMKNDTNGIRTNIISDTTKTVDQLGLSIVKVTVK